MGNPHRRGARRADDSPTLRIRGPADLLQAVPYLLGFHPGDSLVLLGLDRAKVVVTARIDLTDLADDGLLDQVVAAMADGGVTLVVAAIYDDEPADPGAPVPWAGVVRELDETAARAGCAVGDVLRVCDGHWWSYHCVDPLCCPPAGNPLPEAPSPFVAEATYAGMVALPDRESLAAVLDPAPEAERARLEPLLEAQERAAVHSIAAGESPAEEQALVRELFATARAADRSGPPSPLEDATVARLGSALSLIRLRDVIWTAIDRGDADGRALWRELARRLPSPYDAAPLFLFGWASWRAGNGALAAIATERALTSQPEYGAAELLGSILSHALDPRRFPHLGDDAPDDAPARQRGRPLRLVQGGRRGGRRRQSGTACG